MKGKLQAGAPELHYQCDVCKNPRSHGNHRRCSRIRQRQHADRLRDDEYDKSLMFDKKE